MLLRRVLARRRLPQGADAVRRLAIGAECQGTDDVDLDVDLLGPVGGPGGIAQFLQPCLLLPGGVAVAAARRSDAAGKGVDRLGVRVLRPGVLARRGLQLQYRRPFPVAGLEGQPCRHGGIGERRREVVDHRGLLVGPLQHVPSRRVLGHLQMRIDQVVVGVMRVQRPAAVNLGRRGVGGD